MYIHFHPACISYTLPVSMHTKYPSIITLQAWIYAFLWEAAGGQIPSLRSSLALYICQVSHFPRWQTCPSQQPGKSQEKLAERWLWLGSVQKASGAQEIKHLEVKRKTRFLKPSLLFVTLEGAEDWVLYLKHSQRSRAWRSSEWALKITLPVSKLFQKPFA